MISHDFKNEKKATSNRIHNLPIRYERVQKVKSIGHTRCFCMLYFSLLKNLKYQSWNIRVLEMNSKLVKIELLILLLYLFPDIKDASWYVLLTYHLWPDLKLIVESILINQVGMTSHKEKKHRLEILQKYDYCHSLIIAFFLWDRLSHSRKL